MQKSLFLKAQGNTPRNRIWDFLIVYQEYDYSMKDIAKFSGVGYTTLKKIWKDFEKNNLVVNTRNVGKAKMYKLNVDNSVVQKFTDFYWSVIDSKIREQNVIPKTEHKSASKQKIIAE